MYPCVEGNPHEAPDRRLLDIRVSKEMAPWYWKQLMQIEKDSTSASTTLLQVCALGLQVLISLFRQGHCSMMQVSSCSQRTMVVASLSLGVHIYSIEGKLWTWKLSCMQASKGAVRQTGKELSKEEKQKARETFQMEKQASKEGKKRARDDSKPAKADGNLTLQ